MTDKINHKQPEGNQGKTYIGACIAIGVGVGVAIGVALNQIPIGVAIGVAAGAIVGVILEAKRKKEKSDSQ